MIRITAELLPKGDEARKSHLGTITISNDGTGTATAGNYKAVLSKRGSPDSTWREAHFSGFPRKRLGIYDLLLGILAVAVGDRIPGAAAAKKRREKVAGYPFDLTRMAVFEPHPDGQLWRVGSSPRGRMGEVCRALGWLRIAGSRSAALIVRFEDGAVEAWEAIDLFPYREETASA